MLEFGLLGPMVVSRDGRELALPPGKQRSLLALLLLHRNDTVSSERIVDTVWGESAPPTARNALQGHISSLRKKIGSGRIETRPPGYRLRVEPEELDIDRFEELIRAARGAVDSARRAELARQALDTFRGEPLAEFRYETFAQGEIARLQELRLVAMEERIDAELELGHDADLIAELERLVAAEPLRERLCELLMLALYRSGRQADALEVYRSTREALVGQLGLEPGPRLHELERAILGQDPSLGSRQRHRLPTGRLPSPAHPMIGRERELAEAADLVLGPGRLVTITGVGGCGKTRFGLEVARTVVDRFDYVAFIALAALAAPELVSSTVATSLEIDGVPGRPIEETLADVIGDLRFLLVLDNAEHVLSGTAFLALLLERCPRLTLLVTSRAPLRLAAEREFPLEPLRREEADILFRARAQAADPRFVADDEIVDQICEWLDDLPLALELAAAQTKFLAPAELLSRLAKRLEFLTNSARDAPDRQRTLRSAIDWSYELLPQDASLLFARLSVFAGGCALHAAEVVCDASVDAVGTLVDASLLRRSADSATTRFWMLETVREYARERLEDFDIAAATRRAHAAWFVELAESTARKLAGPDQLWAVATLDAEADNLRTALAWSRVEEPVWALRIAAALGRYWGIRGRFGEARSWLDAVVPSAGLDPAAGARALLAGGNIARYQGDRKGARAFFERGVAHTDAVGPPEYTARFLTALGQIERADGNTAAARKHFEEALSVRIVEDADTEAVARANLALVSLDVGDLDAAAKLLTSSIDVFSLMGDQARMTQVIAHLAYVQLEREQIDEARASLLRGLGELGATDDVAVSAFTLIVAAIVIGEQLPVLAARWLGFAEATYERLGREWEPLDQRARGRALAALGPAIESPELAMQRAAGAEIPSREAIAEALSVLSDGAATAGTPSPVW